MFLAFEKCFAHKKIQIQFLSKCKKRKEIFDWKTLGKAAAAVAKASENYDTRPELSNTIEIQQKW